MRASLMRALACAVVLLVCTAGFVRAAGEAPVSDVVVLTDDNFDELTSSGSWMLEFYAPWCGHCKTLAPTYEDAARRLRGTLHLAKIDATVQTQLATRYDIKGFPSLKFLREGELRSYNGPRTVDGLVNFGKEMNAPAVTPLASLAEFEALATRHPVSIVFFGGKAGVERRLFDSLAYRLQGLVKFLSVDKSLSDVYEKAGVKADETPLVLLVTKNAESSDPANRYSGPWVDVELREFIVKNKLPLVSELDQSNFEEVTSSGKRIVYAVVNTKQAKQSEAFVDSLYRLAKLPAFRETFVFASIDGVKYHKYVSQFGVQVGEAGSDASQLPTVVVIDQDLDYFYAPKPHGPPDHPITHPIGDAAAVERFLNDVLSGGIALSGTTPWYNPGRYVKILEKSLSKLPVWQVAVLAVAVMLAIVALMFWCCFYGLDASDEEALAEAEAEATQRSVKKKTDKNEESLAASTPTEGLRSRKGNQ